MANKLKTLTLALAAAGLATGAVQAFAAAPLAPLFNPAPVATLLSDNSGEAFVDSNANGLVDVGDIFITIVGINTIGPTTIGQGTAFNELTAISVLKVATAGDIDLGPPGADDSFGTQAIDLWQFTFTPLTAADTGVFDWSTIAGCGATNDGLTTGCVFEDSTVRDYTRDSTIAAGIASAINGAFRLRLTLDPLNGDFASSIAPHAIADFGTLPPATAVDNSNIALDETIAAQSWPGLTLLTDITGGNGGVSSPSVTSGFPVFDNLDFTVHRAAVPEPSSLALAALGLLGLGSLARRRKQ